jgi:alkylation response protein AidB-like acyl-CoA dehydrogenase
MDLTLDAPQQEIADTARKLLATSWSAAAAMELEGTESGFAADIWEETAQLGWPALALPPESGGRGAGVLGLSLAVEAMGWAGLSSPLLHTVSFAALPLAWSEDCELVRRWLPRLASGEAKATAALIDGHGANEWGTTTLTGRKNDAGWALSGQLTMVPYATVADVIVVFADLEGVGGALVFVPRESAGLAHSKLHVIGGDPQFCTEFTDVSVSQTDILGSGDQARRLLNRSLDVATVLTVAYGVGLAERGLELARDHAAGREQFGRPIGALQAVAFRCSDIRVEIDAARLVGQLAAWQLDAGRSAALDVAAAKAYANDMLSKAFASAHQVLGAKGFSYESDLQVFSRRAKAAELAFGSRGFHYERIADALEL